MNDRNPSPAPRREWALIATNGKVATTYPTKDEAENAARWYVKTYGSSVTIEEVEGDGD